MEHFVKGEKGRMMKKKIMAFMLCLTMVVSCVAPAVAAEVQTEGTEISSETETEAEVVTGAETEAETVTETKTETEIKSETEAETEIKSETETETVMETMTETEIKSETETETATEVNTETAAETEIESETDQDSDIIASGVCSADMENEVIWTLYSTGIMDIRGFGDIQDYDYSSEKYPDYYEYRSQIKKVQINEGVFQIGNYAFADCTNLSIVELSDSVSTIGSYAFYQCKNLKSVVRSEYSSFGIGEYAFEGTAWDASGREECGDNFGAGWNFDSESCTLTISDSTMLERNCNNDAPWKYSIRFIKKIIIKEGGNQIGSNWFSYYPQLEEVIIPASVERISYYAFSNTNLSSVTIPATVKYLEDQAFGSCKNLTTVEISDSTQQSGRPFYGTPWEANNAPTEGTNGDIKWKFNKETGTLTISGTGEGVMPDTYGSGAPWSELAPLVQSIEVQTGVKNIGNLAFEEFTSLESVLLDDTVTKIGFGAFQKCSSLQNITIPDHLEIIEDYAFNNCVSLQNVIIPDGVTEIGEFAFGYCKALTEVIIPDSVEIIGAYAFSGCESLETISIGSGVNEVEYSSFFSTPWLKNHFKTNDWLIINNIFVRYNIDSANKPETLIIPDGVTSIAGDAFEYCSDEIKTVILPDSLTTIRRRGFASCGIGSIQLPDSIQTIETQAFYYCSALTEITIPDSIQTIESETFYNCYSLIDIVIPDSVKTIGNFAFYGCASLVNISIPADVELGIDVFMDTGWYREYQEAGTLAILNGHLVYGFATDAEVSIPDTVRYIENRAFYGNEYLEKVVIPETVIAIRDWAFRDCINLTDVIISSATELGYKVFDGTPYGKKHHPTEGNCGINGDNLKWKYEKETGILTISGTGEMDEMDPGFDKWDAFNGEIQKLVIEEGVTSTGYGAFMDCIALEEVSLPSTLVSIAAQTFLSCSALTSVTIPYGVKSMNYGVFALCTNLKTVSLPDSVTVIDELAFGRSGLETINIPENVKEIGLWAFNNTNLTELTLPSGLKWVKEEAFIGCKQLKNVTVESTSVTLDRNAFSGCISLEEVSFTSPDEQEEPAEVRNAASSEAASTFALKARAVEEAGVAYAEEVDSAEGVNSTSEEEISGISFGFGVFSGCSSLKNIVLSNHVMNLGEETFKGCSALTEITIPDGVTSIGKGVFASCTSLQTIVIPASVTTIAEDAFAGCSEITICGKEGSAAEDFAKENNLTFVAKPVGPVDVEKITLNPTLMPLYIGESGELTVSFTPENATDQTVVWTSSNEKVAVVADGTVTAKATGTAVITAETSNGKTAACTVAVAPAEPSGLKAVALGRNAVIVNWKKVKEADGYRIYCKNNTGEWESIGTTGKTSFVHKGLKTGKTYTYMVRAYILVDGKEVYGPYNETGVSARLSYTVPGWIPAIKW